MDFNTFAQDKKDCYTAENGFLLWKLTEDTSFIPCFFNGDEGNIIAHILVCEGELDVRHGADCYTLGRSTLSSFIDKPQLQLLSASSGIQAYVMVGKDFYMDALLRNNPPIPFSYVLKTRKNPIGTLDAATLHLFRYRMESLREVCTDTCNLFRDKMIKCAIWMFLMDIADRYIRNGGYKDPDATDRAMQLFTGFMRMLPEHVVCEHFVGFYADNLCVTSQYLNRVVKAVSGRTVSDWINFTLIGEITKRLENTDDSMQQIAADFNFPDQASLTKFYKRNTGYSLTEYKKKKRLL